MPTAPEFKAPFKPESFYHIVCKSVDGIDLFREDADYKVFQQRFKQFTNIIFDAWAYCLLANHAHYIVKTKTAETILKTINEPDNATLAMNSWLYDPDNELLFDVMAERQMNSFLVSFANYSNNKYSRKGGLFQKPFRRIEVVDDSHLQQAIIYTHANAQKHALVKDFKDHPYNSYTATVHNDPIFTDTKSVVDFFGGIEKFKSIHKSQVEYYYSNSWPSSKLE